MRCWKNFNSRPSARGDKGNVAVKPLPLYFNSRPSARGDATRAAKPSMRILFQFTPLREGRLKPLFFSGEDGYFNSRPSARGDRLARTPALAPCDFNSRPSARGDRTAGRRWQIALIFQFTPLREGRLQFPAALLKLCHFNSRPSARGDSALKPRTFEIPISIHAPPRGATP